MLSDPKVTQCRAVPRQQHSGVSCRIARRLKVTACIFGRP